MKFDESSHSSICVHKRNKQNKKQSFKMFKYLLVVALFAYAVNAQDADAHAEIKLLKNDVRHDGFDWAVETSNHIQEQRSGDEHGNIKGDFSWISHEGIPIKIAYVADEHGYQPKYVLETKKN